MLRAYFYGVDWHSAITGFKHYLTLERSMSPHSVQAYLRDVEKLQVYGEQRQPKLVPEQVSLHDLEDFLSWFQQFGLDDRSQARMLSGIRAFYKYLMIEDLVQDDPTELIDVARELVGREAVGDTDAGAQTDEERTLRVLNHGRILVEIEAPVKSDERDVLEQHAVHLD